MKYRFFVAFILVVAIGLVGLQSFAQDNDSCTDISLTDTYVALLNAQVAINNENIEAALTSIAEARASLEAIQADCDVAPPPMVEALTVEANGPSISGTVSDEFCDPTRYKIFIHAGFEGDWWYIQPTVANPNIEIQSDCTWITVIRDYHFLNVSIVDIDFETITDIDYAGCPLFDHEQMDQVHATVCN